MIFQQKKIPAWGLDIGDKSLKLISLQPQGQKYNVVNYNSVTLPDDAFDNGKIVNEPVIIESINKLINEAQGSKLRSRLVYSCLPETQSYIKLITIPEMTDKEIPEAVHWASEHHIPIPPDQIYLDWKIISRDKEKHEIKVLIGAILKQISDSYTQLLKKVDLSPLSLEIEATAIARALIDEKHLTNPDEAVALIDIGATRTSLNIYNHPTIQFTYSLPFAGSAVTNIISQELSLTMEQAEQAKIICGLDSEQCKGALKKILDDKLNELVEKIKAAIKFYQKEFSDHLEIKHIILCGGGSHFKGIDKFLASQLNYEVSLGSPLNNINIDKDLNFPSNELLSYTTAIGLAMKAYE